MKVLITGGCGFVGSNLAAAYLKSCDEVILLDSLERYGSIENLEWIQAQANNNQLRFYKVDISDRELLFEIVRDCAPFDYVCHLAGQVAMTTSMMDPIKDFKSNAVGTLNLLEACRQLAPSAFIAYSSTNKVYGDLAHLSYGESESRYILNDYGGELDESLPLDFSTPYGCSKGAADQYVRDWARTYGQPTVVFRHSSIYGGRQFSTYDQGWLGWFCLKVLEQKRSLSGLKHISPFTVSGSGKQVRDLLHVDDVVRLYRETYHKKDSVVGLVFNIGGGFNRSMSIIELLSRLQASCEISSLRYEKIARRERDQNYFVANTARASEIIGWSPLVDLNDGLDQVIEWASHVIDNE